MGANERGSGFSDGMREWIQEQTGPGSYTENTVLKNAMTGEFMSPSQHALWWQKYREAYALERQVRQKHPEKTKADYTIYVAETDGPPREVYITPQISAMISASLAVSEIQPTGVAV